MKRKILLTTLCLLVVMALTLVAHAEQPAHADVMTAQDITGETKFSGTGYDSFSFLKDGNIKSYKKSANTASITLENSQGISSLYLLFDLEYGEYTITDNDSGSILSGGVHGFLHEFIDLESAFLSCPTSITLDFEKGSVRLSEIYVFSAGEVPEFVQKWEAPLDGGADLMLLATHGDDDQLFFAGLLPYYAGELDCRVQVAYLTDHRNLTYGRTHEMLNGLWSVGVEAYPVFGEFSDFRIDSLQGTYDEYASQGVSKDKLLEYVVELLRRFRPQAVVGHDVNGEYGHGMHMVYTDLLRKAVEISNDANEYPDVATQYGVWDVPKTYIHLWEENPIVMDYDTPLSHFGGMTAFEVTQKLGYPCHESQQYTWFTRWINGSNGEITKATQITTYNPCNFGLYRTTVGDDVQKNDFMENLTTYEEQERIEQERLEQERLEQERLEQERLEQERLEQERLEQERLEKERLEQERLEKERQEAAQAAMRKKLLIAAGCLCILVILLIIVISALIRKRPGKRVR